MNLLKRDFPAPEVKAIKYRLSLVTCPGLPGKTAPKSAGELIAKSIISYLERTGENGTQL